MTKAHKFEYAVDLADSVMLQGMGTARRVLGPINMKQPDISDILILIAQGATTKILREGTALDYQRFMDSIRKEYLDYLEAVHELRKKIARTANVYIDRDGKPRVESPGWYDYKNSSDA